VRPDQEAPLYSDSLRVAAWVVQHVPATSVGSRVQAGTLDLCEGVAVALATRRPEAIAELDVRLVRLRVVLRLALDVGDVPESSFLFLSRELDTIGRQIGGWRKRTTPG